MRRLAVLVAVLSGVLAGCAQPVGGTAAPATSSTAPTTDGTPAVELPPRPREVRLDGIDPCSLITEEQRAELGLDQEPVLDVNPSTLYNGGVTQLCSIRGFEPRVIRVAVELSVTGGVELFLRPGVPARLTPTAVQGFPAIVAVPQRFDSFCTVVVDVAPGQLVDTSASNGGGQPPIPQSELCREAERLAEVVMGNLLAQH